MGMRAVVYINIKRVEVISLMQNSCVVLQPLYEQP